MATTANQFDKDPQDVLDWANEWSTWLDGDTLSASTWTPPTGITVVTDSIVGTKSVVWLSGGTLGATYRVVNHITTAAGREKDQSLIFRMVNK